MASHSMITVTHSMIPFHYSIYETVKDGAENINILQQFESAS